LGVAHARAVRRWKIRDLLADSRYGQAVLDFLTSTDVGRLVPPLEDGDARSEVSEWELRERREREEKRKAEAEERECCERSRR